MLSFSLHTFLNKEVFYSRVNLRTNLACSDFVQLFICCLYHTNTLPVKIWSNLDDNYGRYSQITDLHCIEGGHIGLSRDFFSFPRSNFGKLLICCSGDPIVLESTIKQNLAIFSGWIGVLIRLLLKI